MSSIIAEIKESFRDSAMTSKLIYVNVGLFLLVRLADLLGMFGVLPYRTILAWFTMPTSIDWFVYKPWTLFTYMFCHYDFIHLLLNMLCLHWFGRLFASIIGERHILSTYIIGGLIGGVACVVGLSLVDLERSQLLGASASVLSLLLAVAVIAPNYSVHVTFIGNVKLKYCALVMVMVDIISLPTFVNIGGHFAHLGGAILGVILALRWKKTGIPQSNILMETLARVGKPKMKVRKGGRVKSDYEYNTERVERSARVDRILDKIKGSGYDSLTTEEKKALFEDSKNL